MSMLLLDVGNTATRIALWDGKKIGAIRRIPTADLTSAQLPPGIPLAGACVVPDAWKRLETDDRPRFRLSADNCGNLLDFSRMDASTLGADRIANAIALAETFPLPGAVIDCGTAITMELVDAERRFLGGAILPGRNLLRRALFSGTAQLPELPLANDIPDAPGTNTCSAMKLGMDRGSIGAVREMLAVAEKFLGSFTLVFTGGDAPFFAKAFPEAVLAPEDFTLQGVLLAARSSGSPEKI